MSSDFSSGYYSSISGCVSNIHIYTKFTKNSKLISLKLDTIAIQITSSKDFTKGMVGTQGFVWAGSDSAIS